jgi:adenosylmethionine-8-amino-7-oxononanoate aminotransferase
MRINSIRKRIAKLDREHIWHPFTQMKDWMQEEPLIITEGKGAYLKDIMGRWYLDGVSSLWVTVHGHGRKEICDAIMQQMGKISHSTMLGLTHPPAAELAGKLIGITPKGLNRVFYSDNGSTAVEVALKMAFQYWQLKGRKKKQAFLSLNNAYHGDTVGSVSVGGIELFHEIFSPLLFNAFRAPAPYCYRCELNLNYPSCKLACLYELERIAAEKHDEIAAVILEPLVQGAAGMITQPPGYLKNVRKICRKYDLLMIIDEVATGFGRTGRMFACEHENVSPDILCLAKGLTGGYLPLAATVTTEKIFRAFLGKYEDLKTFFHGHSYTGNQLGCAAALASLDIFKKDRTLQKMQGKISLLSRGLQDISAFSHVGEIRQRGFMVGIELVRDKKTGEPYSLGERTGWKVCERAREKGLVIRPLGNVVVLMPHLSISRQELKSLLRITAEAVKEVTG